METWPSYLPNPSVNYSGDRKSAVLRTKGAGGIAVQRLRFDRELWTYKVSWSLTDFQYGMFQSWFLHKLAAGSAWFTVSLGFGDGLTPVTARFGEAKFSAQQTSSLNWSVSATLEVDYGPVLTEAQYDTLLTELGLVVSGDDFWPDYLPNPNNSLSVELRPQTVRVQMESGRYRQSRAFTSELRNVRVSWTFTDVQWRLFQSWLKHKVAAGANWFTVSLPLNGDALHPVSARIVSGDYSMSYESVLYWTVSATLEVSEANVWSEADYEALLVAGSIDALEAAVTHVDSFVDT